MKQVVRGKFDEVQSNFDFLFKRDVDRHDEYLAICEQITMLDKRVENVEKKVA